MRKIIGKFVNNIAEYNNFSKEQKEEIQYTLNMIFYEFTKIALVIIIYSFLGCFRETLMILFVMGITKPFIGGYHEDSQFKCFIATVILVGIIIQLSETVKMFGINTVILSILIIFAIYNKAPIINDKMPITKEKFIKRNRVIGVGTTTLLLTVALVFNKSGFSQMIIWTMLIQSILMFNKNEFRNRYNINND